MTLCENIARKKNRTLSSDIYKVERATPKDADELITFLVNSDEANYPEEVIVREVLSVLEGDGVAGIVRQGKRIAASIGLSFGQLWYSDQHLLNNRWHYVAPEYRKSHYAKSLLRFAKRCSDRLDSPIIMEIDNIESMTRKRELYIREFNPCGAIWLFYPEKVNLPATVKIATPYCEQALLNFVDALAEDNAYSHVDFSKGHEAVRRVLNEKLDPSKGGIIGIIGTPEYVEAAILLKFEWSGLSNSIALVEHFAFVRPEFRKSNHAKDLLNFAKWTANTFNLPLSIGVLSEKRVDSKIYLYARSFGEPSRYLYSYKGKF